ncbi:MAG: hypothetical protein EA387_00985, partial [Nitriliruptor sp.]
MDRGEQPAGGSRRGSVASTARPATHHAGEVDAAIGAEGPLMAVLDGGESSMGAQASGGLRRPGRMLEPSGAPPAHTGACRHGRLTMDAVSTKATTTQARFPASPDLTGAATSDGGTLLVRAPRSGEVLGEV